MSYQFEVGDRVQLTRPVENLPPSGRGTVVRRYVRVLGTPDYVVRFDHDEAWDDDHDVPEFLLKEETPQ